jgi:hypothetical protein
VKCSGCAREGGAGDIADFEKRRKSKIVTVERTQFSDAVGLDRFPRPFRYNGDSAATTEREPNASALDRYARSSSPLPPIALFMQGFLAGVPRRIRHAKCGD